MLAQAGLAGLSAGDVFAVDEELHRSYIALEERSSVGGVCSSCVGRVLCSTS